MTFMTRLTLPIRWEVTSKVNAKRASALLLALGLTGCGGGDEGGSGGDNSPLPPFPAEQVQVVDGFSVAKPNERTQLDLSAFVRGRGATLTSLTSEQPECGAGSVSGLTAEVNISDTTLCQYRFSAKISASAARSSGSAEGVATLSVLATLAATPVLEPLSAAMTLSDTTKTFDVVALYGASLPAGYNLKAGSVVVQGGGVQGTATQSGNVITYAQPGAADWNRVLFTLEDPAKPGEDILGTLYITVSETANQAPTISKTKYNYSDAANAGANNPSIVTFQSVILDLANLKNLTITDPDSSEWQLIEVQSYSASVASAAPDDVNNKKFTFTAGTVGQHIVSYIVGDHEGGYRMGLMSITVGPKEQTKDWANIDLVTPGLRFYAPPLFSELINTVGPQLGAFVEPVWDNAANGTGNTIGAAGNLAATAYCSGKRLPKQADLGALRTATGTPATEWAKYPKARPYLISDAVGTTFQTYDLTNGNVAAYMAGTTPNPYVVCVSDHGLSYIATPNTPYTGMTNTVVSDGTWQTIGAVNSGGGTTGASPTLFGTPTNAGPGSLGVGNFRLTPGSCAGGTCTLDAKGASDEYGTATAQIANAVMTSKTFNVATTFLQNAQVTAASATTNNAKADDTATNVITLTLKDKAGNAVPSGTPVKLNYTVTTSPSFSPTITPASNTTVNVSASGTVAMNIKSSTVGTVTLTDPVVVNGLPLAATSTTATFVTPNAAPVGTVSLVAPTTASAGELFVANWTYSDAEGDPSLNSVVNWYLNGSLVRADPVTGAGGKLYYRTSISDTGKLLLATITPRASAGTLVGATVSSSSFTLITEGSGPGVVSPKTVVNMGVITGASYCAGLVVNGYTGFRLATYSELATTFAAYGLRPSTTDLCSIVGWPMHAGNCGGSSVIYITPTPWPTDSTSVYGFNSYSGVWQIVTGTYTASNVVCAK